MEYTRFSLVLEFKCTGGKTLKVSISKPNLNAQGPTIKAVMDQIVASKAFAKINSKTGAVEATITSVGKAYNSVQMLDPVDLA